MESGPHDKRNARTWNRGQSGEGSSHPAGAFICPMCKRPVPRSAEGSIGLPRFFPFCSERCKLIDLGVWFDAGYRIPAKPDEEADK